MIPRSDPDQLRHPWPPGRPTVPVCKPESRTTLWITPNTPQWPMRWPYGTCAICTSAPGMHPQDQCPCCRGGQSVGQRHIGHTWAQQQCPGAALGMACARHMTEESVQLWCATTPPTHACVLKDSGLHSHRHQKWRMGVLGSAQPLQACTPSHRPRTASYQAYQPLGQDKGQTCRQQLTNSRMRPTSRCHMPRSMGGSVP